MDGQLILNLVKTDARRVHDGECALAARYTGHVSSPTTTSASTVQVGTERGTGVPSLPMRDSCPEGGDNSA